MQYFVMGIVVGSLLSSAITTLYIPKLVIAAWERRLARRESMLLHPSAKFPMQRKGK